MRTTSTRIAAAGIAALTVLVLGSPPVGDYVVDDLPSSLDSFQQVAFTLIHPRYWVSGFELDENLGLALFGILFVLLVAALAGFAAKAGTAMARFLAGWGVVLVAAAVAGLIQAVYLDNVAEGFLGAGDFGEAVFREIERSVAYAFWTGWLVAAVIALVGRPPTTIVSSSAPYPPAQPWSPGPPPGSGWDPPPPAPHAPAPPAAPGPEDATRQWQQPPPTP